MSQPVKLSDSLVLDARLAGEVEERSIAGQVEFWAKLGRSVESLLNGKQVLALRRSAEAESISDALAIVDTPVGRNRVQEVVARGPYPHFKQFPGRPRLLIRIDEDGTETVGRFVNRVFVPAPLGQSRTSSRASGAAGIGSKARSSARTRAHFNQSKSKTAA